MKRYIIGVIGDVHLDAAKRKMVVTLYHQLVDANYRIVSGGHGDIAKALAEGARKSTQYHDGDLITVLPGFDPSVADDYSDITIATGIDHARTFIKSETEFTTVRPSSSRSIIASIRLRYLWPTTIKIRLRKSLTF